MEDWQQFKSFEDYVDWVELRRNRGSHVFSFKVFPSLPAVFLGLGNFFHSFFPDAPSDKKTPAVETVLGPLTSSRLRLLNPNAIFADPEAFPRQGDIFQSDAGCFPALLSKPTHWIVVSQTCVIAADTFSVVAPCYDKDRFKAALAAIKPEKFGNTGFLSSVFENKTVRFVPLPVYAPLGEEPLIIDLGYFATIKSAYLKGLKPRSSFTYPGLAYFSNRLAITLLRDVKNCDDRRTVS